ncbi:MAG: amidohydrolase family protein, partial [Candidatus Dormibacteraeota bacterium]|nr:amidohydrolase family protein [Candidatus Dormibacteraeota bacterium]
LGILTPVAAVEALHNEDLTAALAGALNDWLRDRWLDADPRHRGAITLAPQSPTHAAEEVERCAADPRFVQAVLPLRCEVPLGRRFFWPVYEACERHGIPLAVRPGGGTGMPTTPVGWPALLIEDLASQAQAYQSQLMSLIAEGALAHAPRLKVVLLGSGVTWLPSLLWRLDKNWRGIRREVPWVDALPSRVVHERVRLTVRPFDAPPDAHEEVLNQLGTPKLLLYAGGEGSVPDLDVYDENARDTYPRLGG